VDDVPFGNAQVLRRRHLYTTDRTHQFGSFTQMERFEEEKYAALQFWQSYCNLNRLHWRTYERGFDHIIASFRRFETEPFSPVYEPDSPSYEPESPEYEPVPHIE